MTIWVSQHKQPDGINIRALMKYIDTFLNRITMYRLLIYYLVALIGVALFFSALGVLSYSPFSIVESAILFVGISFVLNYIFARLWNTPTNWESSILTGLILTLIVSPPVSFSNISFIVAAASLAIASKYILAIHNKHIFNPAAIAVVLTAFGSQETASWWVGSTALMPFVVIGGFLLVRKIRRTKMSLIFVATALIVTELMAVVLQKDISSTFQTLTFHSSLFFLAFVMLTEPLTSPTTKTKRYIYAALVGVLFAPFFHIGSIYATPELALVIGNVVAFFISPMVKTKAMIGRRHFFGNSTEAIELLPERPFNYRPGQYLELTLPHVHADNRGLRRYFTIASSPTEKNLQIGVRYYNQGSTLKSALRKLKKPLVIGQIGGDFVLPKNPSKKLAFIAGGIGITPFRSMIKYLIDANDSRSATLLYGERSIEDIAYADIFETARLRGNINTTYVIPNQSTTHSPYILSGQIDQTTITTKIPDYLDRIFYVSGPQAMVKAMRDLLVDMGVPRRHIKVDYFSGYA